MRTRTPANDDVVPTAVEAVGNKRPPLVVVDRLAEYLDSIGLGSGTPTLTRVGNGLSNVTYLIERGEARFILRRPPRPPWPPSAHDVLREARVQQALWTTTVLVPEILGVCDDETLIGAPFYLLGLVDGGDLDRLQPQ